MKRSIVRLATAVLVAGVALWGLIMLVRVSSLAQVPAGPGMVSRASAAVREVAAQETSTRTEISNVPLQPLDGPITPPARLAIFYGWPSQVNDAHGDLDRAAATFAQFDLVVLGDGLEDPSHEEHANTQAIIGDLNASGVQVFGYVDLGSTQNLSMPVVHAYVEEWHAMGVAGIFVDEAGKDWGVDRSRLADAVSHVHALGLQVFVNAWDPIDVCGEDPPGTPSPLGPGDWYLAESHPVSDGQCGDLDRWWTKSQAIVSHCVPIGVKIAAVSTGDDGPAGWANHPAFRQALWATYLFDFDALGFTNPNYSASGSGADRLRFLPPLATDVGDNYAGPPIGPVGNPPTYRRLTDRGAIDVWGDGGTCGGIFRGGACDTTDLGDRIWPTCDPFPPGHSSPFGPRQRASESCRYDWHRGADIPQPAGEPVYAVMDGVVRIAGDHPAYSDKLVQIRHGYHAPYLFSNYLHMTDTAAVSEGDLVTVGDLIGYSGESAVSEFEHIHLEFRDGCLYQDCNRNPWGYLPYTDTLPPAPTLAGANLSLSGTLLLLQAETPSDQLDLDGLALTWGAGTARVSWNDINATTDRDFPQGLDHPLVHLGGTVDVCLLPALFRAGSPTAQYRMAFRGLDAAATTGSAAQLDLNRAGPPLALAPELPALTLSPASQQFYARPGDTLPFVHILQNTGTEPLALTLAAQSAQNNALALSHADLTLVPGASQAITLTVTLSQGFPAGVGDCVVLEVDAGTGISVIALDSAQTIEVAKTVTPQGGVEYGDELTYTLVLSAAPGTRVALYDPLIDTAFSRFVARPTTGAVTHTDGVISGVLTITPANRVTVGFVVRVSVPITAGSTVSVANRACVNPFGGTLDRCIWSEPVANPSFRPYVLYLPLSVRND